MLAPPERTSPAAPAEPGAAPAAVTGEQKRPLGTALLVTGSGRSRSARGHHHDADLAPAHGRRRSAGLRGRVVGVDRTERRRLPAECRDGLAAIAVLVHPPGLAAVRLQRDGGTRGGVAVRPGEPMADRGAGTKTVPEDAETARYAPSSSPAAAVSSPIWRRPFSPGRSCC